MGAMQDDRCFTSDWIVRGWNWGALGKATIVDLGGGIGTVSKALAKAFPLLEFVVQDRAEVIAEAVVEDPEIQDRVRFMAHDIFAEQPYKDADVYLFRRVMMEKSDRECEDILRALRPALKKGSYILVQDPMVRIFAASYEFGSADFELSYYQNPDPGTCPLWQERRFRESDMLSLALASIWPRDSAQWANIAKQAGPGFEYRGVTMARGSNTAFVEIVWTGAEGVE
jgi:hypothetical protein